MSPLASTRHAVLWMTCLTAAGCIGAPDSAHSTPAERTTETGRTADEERVKDARIVDQDATAAERLIERLGLEEDAAPIRDRPGWEPLTRVLIYDDPELERALSAAAPDVEFVSAAGLSAARARAAGVQALIGFFCAPGLLQAATELRWIQTPSAGVEGCVANRGLLRGAVLTNAQRLHGPPLGEHAIALMLTLSRQLHAYARAQAAGRWAPEAGAMWEVDGKTLHVVGLGGIGTEVAQKAHALGMRVTATRRSSRDGPDFVDYVGLADEADSLIALADVVVAAVPLTDETRGMFDAGFFSRMKRGALFINLGRGRSVVTGDLIDAVESGQLAGAGLDVVNPEPLPPGHRIWSVRNIVITPHVGSGSDRTADRFRTLAAENLRRYMAGEPMLSVVDLDRGY